MLKSTTFGNVQMLSYGKKEEDSCRNMMFNQRFCFFIPWRRKRDGKKKGFFIFCGVFAHLSVVLIKKKWELSRSTSSLSYSKGVYTYCTWQMVSGKKGVIGFYEGTSRLDPFYVLSMSWWDDFISLLNIFFFSLSSFSEINWFGNTG